MKCTILHEGKGRMRVHVEKVRMTLHRADVLEAYLNHNDAIVHATVYERTGDVVITYTGKRSPPGAENLPRPGVFVAFAIVKCLVILYIVGNRAASTPISCVHCTESTKYPGDFRQAFSPYLGLWACISTGYGI